MVLELLIPIVTGIILCIIYLLCLWYTVKELDPKHSAVARMGLGMLFRLSLIGGTFYIMLQAYQLKGLLICAMSFIITRFIAMIIIKKKLFKMTKRGN